MYQSLEVQEAVAEIRASPEGRTAKSARLEDGPVRFLGSKSADASAGTTQRRCAAWSSETTQRFLPSEDQVADEGLESQSSATAETFELRPSMSAT